MAVSEDAVKLKLDGVIGLSGWVAKGMHVIKDAAKLPAGEWIVYPLGSLVVVRQAGTSGVLGFLRGHSNDVSCLCVSKDGTRLASGQRSQQGVAADVIVWDLVEACEAALAGETCSEKVIVHRLRQHKGAVAAVSMNCEDALLATLGGRDDNALVVWNIETGEAICGQPAAADDALALQWLNLNPCRLVTCGSRHVRVWQVDVSLPKLHAMDASLGSLKRVMRCVAVASDDSYAYVGTTTGEVLKLSADRDGLQLPNDPDRVRPMLKQVSSSRLGMGVTAVACWTNPATGVDNVLAGAGDGTLVLLNPDLHPVKDKKDTVQGGVTSICIVDDDTLAIATTEANRYRLRMRSSPHFRADLVATAHVDGVKSVVFPPDCADLFVTCSNAGDVRVWNAAKRTELLRIRVPNLVCDAVLVANDGADLVSGWSDGRIRSFFPESGKLKFVINEAHSDGVTALAAVPRPDANGSSGASSPTWTLASGGRDGRLRAWRITSSHQPMLFSIKEHRGTITALAISRDGSKLVSASADGSCLCFRLDTQVREFAVIEPTVFTNVKWHPDESQLLTTGSNYKITYWDATDGSVIRVLDGSFTDEMTALDLDDENGAWFLSGSADKTIKFWHYDDGIATAYGLGHSKRINAIKISPDKSTAISVGDEGGIYIWSLDGLN